MPPKDFDFDLCLSKIVQVLYNSNKTLKKSINSNAVQWEFTISFDFGRERVRRCVCCDEFVAVLLWQCASSAPSFILCGQSSLAKCNSKMVLEIIAY